MRSFSFVSVVAVAVGVILLAVVGCQPKVKTTNEATPQIDDTSETVVTTVSFANAKCPIMGGKPDAELTVNWNGKTVGFCCDGCPQKWEKLSEEEKAAKFTAVSHSPESHGPGEHDPAETQHSDAHGDHEQGQQQKE